MRYGTHDPHSIIGEDRKDAVRQVRVMLTLAKVGRGLDARQIKRDECRERTLLVPNTVGSVSPDVEEGRKGRRKGMCVVERGMEGGEKKSRILLAAWIRGIIGSSEAAHAVTGAQRERER